MKLLGATIGWLLTLWGLAVAGVAAAAGSSGFTPGHGVIVAAALVFVVAVNPRTRRWTPLTRSFWGSTLLAIVATAAGFVGASMVGPLPAAPLAADQATPEPAEASIEISDEQVVARFVEPSASPAIKAYIARPGVKAELVRALQSTKPEEAQGCLNVAWAKHNDDFTKSPRETQAADVAFETSGDMAFWQTVIFGHAAKVLMRELAAAQDASGRMPADDGGARLKALELEYEQHPAPMTDAQCRAKRIP